MRVKLSEAILPKLGNRSYSHGTTLYEALTCDIKNFNSLEFQLKKPIFSNKIKIYQTKGWDFPDDINAVLFYKKNYLKYCKYVYDTEYKDNDLRVNYDESEHLFGLEKFEGQIKILSSPYNFIKTIISINKLLLSKYLRPEFFFVYTYLSLTKNIDPKSSQNIILKEYKNFGNFFYTDIFLLSKKIGTIGFKSVRRTDFNER